jgi:hypothetical protein
MQSGKQESGVAQEQGASPVETVKALGPELLQLNLSAFRLGYHGLAYHLLSAALHCAQGSGDVVLAERVQRRAEDQLKQLEELPDTVPPALDGLRGRGAITMFESVAIMAGSVSQRLKFGRSPAAGGGDLCEAGGTDPVTHLERLEAAQAAR